MMCCTCFAVSTDGRVLCCQVKGYFLLTMKKNLMLSWKRKIVGQGAHADNTRTCLIVNEEIKQLLSTWFGLRQFFLRCQCDRARGFAFR